MNSLNYHVQWFDLEESVQKTIKWINEAGAAGCKLVAFPEVCMLSLSASGLVPVGSS